MTSFKHLGLSKDILKAIAELGFEEPSEIQESAIPHLLHGEKNFIGLAQTGTGKTAAFGLPLLEMIDPDDPSTQALILAPTRELGQQIAGQLALFSKYLNRISILPVYGGASIGLQIKALKKPQQVIIATPGRLIDLIERKAIQLNEVSFVILDEADEMLNMGFKEDLDKILSFTPAEKRVWLFSATMPADIRHLVKRYMGQPVEVRVNTKNEVNVNIEHRFAMVKEGFKLEALTRFFDLHTDIRTLVFCRTKVETQNLAEELMARGYKADSLHGDLAQAQRDRVLKRFKENDIQILIATDVASRGIDVSDISHVFHYSLPDETAQYTHRSGRTARAGRQGMSVALIYPREMHRINRMSRELKITFERLKIPMFQDIAQGRMDAWANSILEDRPQAHLDHAIVKRALRQFKDLSKEDLIVRLISHELSNVASDMQQDLNEYDEHKNKHAGNKFKSRHQSPRSHHRKGRNDKKTGKKKFERGWKGK